MIQLADAIRELREAVMMADGKVISITFDENAYDEINKCYQGCAPPQIDNLGTSIMKEFLGIEIKKG